MILIGPIEDDSGVGSALRKVLFLVADTTARIVAMTTTDLIY